MDDRKAVRVLMLAGTILFLLMTLPFAGDLNEFNVVVIKGFIILAFGVCPFVGMIYVVILGKDMHLFSRIGMAIVFLALPTLYFIISQKPL
jgi:hypothetical protein